MTNDNAVWIARRKTFKLLHDLPKYLYIAIGKFRFRWEVRHKW